MQSKTKKQINATAGALLHHLFMAIVWLVVHGAKFIYTTRGRLAPLWLGITGAGIGSALPSKTWPAVATTIAAISAVGVWRYCDRKIEYLYGTVMAVYTAVAVSVLTAHLSLALAMWHIAVTCILGAPWMWHYRHRADLEDALKAVRKVLSDRKIDVKPTKKINRSKYGWEVFLSHPGHTTSELTPHLGTIQSTLKALTGSVSLTPTRWSHRTQLRIMTVDMRVTAPEKLPATLSRDILKPIPVGIGIDGRPRTVTIGRAHTLLAGATGSGKTNTARVLMSGIMRCNNTRLMIIDLKSGMEAKNYRTWLGTECIATDIDGAKKLLNQAIRQMSVHASYTKTDNFVPTKKHPAWVIFVDEAQDLISGGLADEVHEIVSKGRAVGVWMIYGTQYTDNSTIPQKSRSQFLVVIGHASDFATSEQLFGKGSAKSGGWDTSKIPPAPGWAQIKDVTRNITATRMYCVEQNELDEIKAHAAEVNGGTQAERYGLSTYDADDIEYVDAVRADKPIQNTDVDEDDKTDETTEKILAALKAGHKKPSTIMAATGIPSATVTRRLKKLVDEKIIKRTSRGEYEYV